LGPTLGRWFKTNKNSNNNPHKSTYASEKLAMAAKKQTMGAANARKGAWNASKPAHILSNECRLVALVVVRNCDGTVITRNSQIKNGSIDDLNGRV